MRGAADFTEKNQIYFLSNAALSTPRDPIWFLHELYHFMKENFKGEGDHYKLAMLVYPGTYATFKAFFHLNLTWFRQISF